MEETRVKKIIKTVFNETQYRLRIRRTFCFLEIENLFFLNKDNIKTKIVFTFDSWKYWDDATLTRHANNAKKFMAKFMSFGELTKLQATSMIPLDYVEGNCFNYWFGHPIAKKISRAEKKNGNLVVFCCLRKIINFNENFIDKKYQIGQIIETKKTFKVVTKIIKRKNSSHIHDVYFLSSFFKGPKKKTLQSINPKSLKEVKKKIFFIHP